MFTFVETVVSYVRLVEFLIIAKDLYSLIKRNPSVRQAHILFSISQTDVAGLLYELTYEIVVDVSPVTEELFDL